MRSPTRAAILISLLLHAAALVALLLRPSLKISPHSTQLVEYLDIRDTFKSKPRHQSTQATGPVVSQGNSQSRRSEPQRAEPAATDQLFRFAVNSQAARIGLWKQMRLEDTQGIASPTGHESLDPYQNLQESGQGWSQATQYANGMGLPFTNDTLGFFSSLYRKVDSALVYPDDFSRQRIRGKIRIEAELGRDGRLIKFLSSGSNSNVLEAYLLVLLIQVLKDPLPERVWLPTEKAVVAFDFDLRTRTVGNVPTDFVLGTQKNQLLFGREALVDNLLNQKVYDVLTHYVPPIIPLPGGFYVDLVLAYKFVKNLKEGAPTESEARASRIEKLHETLRQTIRQHKSADVSTANES